MKKEDIFLIIMFVSLTISSFLIGYNFNGSNIEKLTYKNNFNTNDSCYNDNVILDSICINEQLKEFYYFNISNIGKDLTTEQLKNEGGVCKNAVDYYVERFTNIGYEYREQSEPIYINDTENNKFIIKTKFRASKDDAHVIAIVSGKDEDGLHYCILDQQNIKCFNLGISNETK